MGSGEEFFEAEDKTSTWENKEKERWERDAKRDTLVKT